MLSKHSAYSKFSNKFLILKKRKKKRHLQTMVLSFLKRIAWAVGWNLSSQPVRTTCQLSKHKASISSLQVYSFLTHQPWREKIFLMSEIMYVSTKTTENAEPGVVSLEPVAQEQSRGLYSLGNGGTGCSWSYCPMHGTREPFSCLGKVWKQQEGWHPLTWTPPSGRLGWQLWAHIYMKVKPSSLHRTKNFKKRDIEVFGHQGAQGMRGGQYQGPWEADLWWLLWGHLAKTLHGSPGDGEEGWEQDSKASSEWERHLYQKEEGLWHFFCCFILGSLLLAATLLPLGMDDSGKSWDHVLWTT